MDRSKNSDGVGDEFTASKKRGKREIVSKDKKSVNKKSVNKKSVNKRNPHKKNANKNITLRRKRGMVHIRLDLHKNTIQMAAVDQNGTLLCNYKFRHTWEDVDSEVSKMLKNAKCVIESSSVWKDAFHFMRDRLRLDDDYPDADIPDWVMTELGVLAAKGDVTVDEFRAGVTVRA